MMPPSIPRGTLSRSSIHHRPGPFARCCGGNIEQAAQCGGAANKASRRGTPTRRVIPLPKEQEFTVLQYSGIKSSFIFLSMRLNEMLHSKANCPCVCACILYLRFALACIYLLKAHPWP